MESTERFSDPTLLDNIKNHVSAAIQKTYLTTENQLWQLTYLFKNRLNA